VRAIENHDPRKKEEDVSRLAHYRSSGKKRGGRPKPSHPRTKRKKMHWHRKRVGGVTTKIHSGGGKEKKRFIFSSRGGGEKEVAAG